MKKNSPYDAIMHLGYLWDHAQYYYCNHSRMNVLSEEGPVQVSYKIFVVRLPLLHVERLHRTVLQNDLG